MTAPRLRARARLRVLGRRLGRIWARRAELELARRFGVANRQDRVFFGLIGAVGVLAGLLGVAVHRLIDGLRALLWGPGPLLEVAAALPAWKVIAIPALGGALVGLVVIASRERVSGRGMGVLIEAVILQAGRIPARPVVASAVAAVATVGSGGSLGREGPMIRLGAMISSRLASRLGVPPYRVKILVGCGAAAGLAAAYNIPIGGALFAMEVILGNFALEIFGPIVASSVLSTLLARALSGRQEPYYAAAAQDLAGGWEILAFLGLGLAGSLVSLIFVFGVRGCGLAFKRFVPLPRPLQPMLGMAMLGVLALFFPHVLSGGVETVNLALAGEITPRLLLLLPLAKLLATGLTAGSGCAGGMFTPSLCVGSLVGAGYGLLVHELWPQATSDPGAYALVGMAVVAAGTSHAPISAILIVFEFTGNYDYIVPLMVACLTSSLVSRRIYPYSTYTEALQRRGVDLSWRMEEAVLAGLKVEDLRAVDEEILRPADDYRAVVERFLASHRQRLFVVDEGGKLMGAVSLHDIKHALEDPQQLAHVVAYDIMSPLDRVLDNGERLHNAAEAFAGSDFERLPVVDGATGTFLGVLAKRDLLSVYAQEVLGRPAMLATFVSGSGSEAARDYVELPPDFEVRLVGVPAALLGTTLAEARLPQTAGIRVLEVKRPGPAGDTRVIPDRDTVLTAGDQLIVLGLGERVEAFAQGRWTSNPTPEEPHEEETPT